MRSYEAARSLFGILAFLAWAVVAIGVVAAFIGAESVPSYAGDEMVLLALAPGIGIGILGLVLVAFVQMGRANVDTAEYTQQMLKISRDQLDVSRQALKQGASAPQGFAGMAQDDPAPSLSKTQKAVSSNSSKDPTKTNIEAEQADSSLLQKEEPSLAEEKLSPAPAQIEAPSEPVLSFADLDQDKVNAEHSVQEDSPKPASTPDTAKANGRA